MSQENRTMVDAEIGTSDSGARRSVRTTASVKVNTRAAQQFFLGCVLVCFGVVTARSATENIGNAATGKWIASDKGCQVYDEAWVPGETVKWSGACEGGRAEGAGK